jgi:DNA-directed RNA polymerase specialized sigma24 family protein
LELSSKEMAAMLGISQESLRKSRYRLRKKFPQLIEDGDFKDAI